MHCGKPQARRRQGTGVGSRGQGTGDGEVVDIFDEAGLRKPDISMLSNEFLADVQGMEHKTVAAEALRELL